MCVARFSFGSAHIAVGSAALAACGADVVLGGAEEENAKGELMLPAIGTVFVIGALRLFQRRMGRLGFYLISAFAATASVQLVGFYLVFATLIVPSLGVRDYADKRRLPPAYFTGIGAHAAGLLLSIFYDLPAGALIVWCPAVLAIIVYALGPKKAVEGVPAHG